MCVRGCFLTVCVSVVLFCMMYGVAAGVACVCLVACCLYDVCVFWGDCFCGCGFCVFLCCCCFSRSLSCHMPTDPSLTPSVVKNIRNTRFNKYNNTRKKQQHDNVRVRLCW